MTNTFTIEYERENDGRWLTEVMELPGVLAYGDNFDEAIANVEKLALRVLTDKLLPTPREPYEHPKRGDKALQSIESLRGDVEGSSCHPCAPVDP